MESYSERVFYTNEQLQEMLERTKKFLDRAYLDTKMKYGKIQADGAMLLFFTKGDVGCFTNSQTREMLNELLYHSDEVYQILMDFAISAYISNKQKGLPQNKYTKEEVNAYHDPDNQSLDYSEERIIDIAALLVAENTYYALNVISYNQRLKEVLTQAFINKRYGDINNKKELDNSKRMTLVSLDKDLPLSKDKLNRDIDNMIRDEDYNLEHFDPSKDTHVTANKKTTL